MSLSEISESEYGSDDRRSSVRARAMLPCSVVKVSREAIPELESRILDAAVLDSEYANLDAADWTDRTDELSREMIFVLNEIRSMRQQLTDMRRIVESFNEGDSLSARWVVINDSGFWLPHRLGDEGVETGDFVEVKLQIPSLTSPNIYALGEVLRVRDKEGRSRGAAIEFRAISNLHSKAILRYALKRERQLARSKLFSSIGQ